MSRPFRARAVTLLALVLAAGCQNYNFNPVGHCLIQPGTERVTLSNISTADVLFVVDDSGSMGGEQQKLAANFSAFIDNLDNANAVRAAAGLQPIDFHLAVTTTSIAWNYQTTETCRSDCPGAVGSLVCCTSGDVPATQPKACTPGVTACPTGTTCGKNCARLKGENYCCNQADGSFPAGSLTDTVPCSREGTMCGTFERHFDFPAACDAGVAVDEWPFPRGDFVSWTSGASANPRVLHFDKELYQGATNRQGFTRQELMDFFAGGGAVGGNVLVGTCGSGEEQGLQAARLALQKAVAGQQKDTFAITPGKVATWDPTSRTASSAAEWPHPNAKLVLVFVGDEDDCSSPEDPSGGIVMLAEPAGNDACVHDATLPAPTGGKGFPVVQQFVDYFTGFGGPDRPLNERLGAAFIVSTAQTQCSGDACTPGFCCQTDCPGQTGCVNTLTCGGQGAGTRFFQAANELRARGADVVLGSICDSQFGAILDQIAEIVKPVTGLTLPSMPAEDEVTLLRIATSTGETRKICGRPLAPGAYPDVQAAQDTGADWWFTASGDPSPPVALSTNVYINPKGSCIANPGETYSADYIGQLPAGGCLSDSQCQQVLGGSAGAWTCFAGVDAGGVCVAPTAGSPGTCLCGPRANNCPNG